MSALSNSHLVTVSKRVASIIISVCLAVSGLLADTVIAYVAKLLFSMGQLIVVCMTADYSEFTQFSCSGIASASRLYFRVTKQSVYY